MPRKKSISVPLIFGDIGAAATRKSRNRRVITDLRTETGDPWQDGEIWLARLMMTRRVRVDRRNGEKDWRRYYRWYQGEQWNIRGDESGQIASDNVRDTATVNKTGSIINSIVPFLINDEIEFDLQPQRPTDDVSAEIQQALLNYEWRKRRMTSSMKRCARDLVIIGHCVAKTGYTVEVDESRKPNDDGELNYADYVKKDAPFAERVNPLQFLFDMNAKDHTLHTSRWCAEYFFTPFHDVLANQNYDRNTLALIRSGDVTPGSRSAWDLIGAGVRPRMDGKPIFPLPEDNVVTLIEIWDKKFKKRFIMADGCPFPLLVEDWPYDYLDNFPYAMCNYIDIPNQPFGLGLPYWIEDQQTRLNRVRTNEVNWISLNQPGYMLSPELTTEEIGKWEDGGAGKGIVGPKDGIVPIPELSLSVDFDKIEARLQRDMEEMTGADSILQGAPLPSRTTADEVSTRARLTGLKLDQHVTDFEEFVEEVGRQVLHHLKKFRTTPDVIHIVGAEGMYWRNYSSDEIQADVDVDVQSFAAPKTNPDILKQQAMQVLQLGIQGIQILAQTGAPQTIDPVQLFGWVFDKFGEKDIGRFFKPALIPRPPLVEGQQQNAPAALPPAPPNVGPGAGMPPAMAGQLAPQPLPQQPQVGNPGEGLTPADLMQQTRGFMQ